MDKDNSFFLNKIQEIHTNQEGEITESSNTMFQLNIGNSIYGLHPFFESLKEEIKIGKETNLAFPCVQLDAENKEYICDITIKKERGDVAILLFDYSTHYQHLHEAAQEKKTAMLNEQAHELNLKHQEEQQVYFNYIKERIDNKILKELEVVMLDLTELKKTSLSRKQATYLSEIEDKVGSLHSKAIQIKEGLYIDLD